MELEHAEMFSPQAKKRKRNNEEEVLKEESVDIASDENLKILEGKSWEKMRMKHREIEIQVNEDELLSMSEFDAQKKKSEVKTRIDKLKLSCAKLSPA